VERADQLPVYELEINLGVIELVAERMTEQRLGVAARPPDSMLDYCARLMFRTPDMEPVPGR
jgi:hypothetical protein